MKKNKSKKKKKPSPLLVGFQECPMAANHCLRLSTFAMVFSRMNVVSEYGFYKHLSECNYQRTVLSCLVVGHSKQYKRTNTVKPQMTDELRVGGKYKQDSVWCIFQTAQRHQPHGGRASEIRKPLVEPLARIRRQTPKEIGSSLESSLSAVRP